MFRVEDHLQNEDDICRFFSWMNITITPVSVGSEPVTVDSEVSRNRFTDWTDALAGNIMNTHCYAKYFFRSYRSLGLYREVQIDL